MLVWTDRSMTKQAKNRAEGFVTNRPTREGYELGAVLAKLADRGEHILLAEDGDAPRRCASCAYKAGTFPNGCPETVLDALKCSTEGIMFTCHHSEPLENKKGYSEMCAGWVQSRVTIARMGGLPAEIVELVSQHKIEDGRRE
jgi:hypothetical protein